MSNVYDSTGKLLNQPAPQMAGYSGVDMDVVDWFETLPGKKYLAEAEALETLEALAAPVVLPAEVPVAPVVETIAPVAEIPAVTEAPAPVVEASVEAPIVPVAEVATAPAQA